MFWVRLRSSIILLALMIAAVVVGHYALFILLLVISLIGMSELYNVEGKRFSVISIFAYLTATGYYLLILFNAEEYRFGLITGLVLALMILYVIRYPKYSISEISLAVFGLIYVTVMLSYIYKLRILEDGAYYVWLIFIGAWGSDTCAYVTGITIGKHKITPLLSPKKSLEGCIGGVVGAMLIAFIYATIFKEKITCVSNPQVAFVIIAAACSVISQVGDLAASGIKRQYNIKDYGNIIPGHGGILDRFDSILFTAPICYALMMIL